jgi:hypothetical protein
MSDPFETLCLSFKPCENLREFQLVGGGMSTGTVVNESEPSRRRQARRLKLAIRILSAVVLLHAAVLAIELHGRSWTSLFPFPVPCNL